MKKNICLIIIVFLITSNPFVFTVFAEIIKFDQDTNTTIDEEWYYLPSYDNYAPKGLPDFDQRQQNDWSFNKKHPYVFCGPTSLANILWWFDSKNSDPEGFPGDGNDKYPLVSRYIPSENLNLKLSIDDHDFNNVNNVNTQWNKNKDSGELIERIAWYSNINYFKIPLFGGPGIDPLGLIIGFKKWLRASDLKDHYSIAFNFRPSFTSVCDHIEDNKGVLLWIASYHPENTFKHFKFGHHVSVAGIKRDGGIALSDPYLNNDSPIPDGEDYTYHNNASIVSHDHYNVTYDCPCCLFSDWWMPDYPAAEGCLICGEIVISQLK